MADATLAGTLANLGISVVGGGITGYVASLWQSRAADRAWRRSRDDLADKQTVDLIRDTVTAISAAGHSGCWLTWKAHYDHGSVSAAHIAAYDREMHELLPRIAGGQAAIAVYNATAAQRIGEAVQIIYQEDGQIGIACILHRRGDRSALGARYEPAVASRDRVGVLCTELAASILRR